MPTPRVLVFFGGGKLLVEFRMSNEHCSMKNSTNYDLAGNVLWLFDNVLHHDFAINRGEVSGVLERITSQKNGIGK